MVEVCIGLTTDDGIALSASGRSWESALAFAYVSLSSSEFWYRNEILRGDDIPGLLSSSLTAALM